MSNRKGKCPGCGLVNLPDVFECQWCGLALRARPRTNPSHEATERAGAPRGLLILIIIVVMGGGGALWKVTRRDAARVDPPAETTEAETKPRKRGGPPSLGDRRTDDAGFSRPDRLLRRGVERNEEFRGVLEEHERGVYGEKEARRARAERALTDKRRPLFLESQPPRDITNDR